MVRPNRNQARGFDGAREGFLWQSCIAWARAMALSGPCFGQKMPVFRAAPLGRHTEWLMNYYA
jgi:hypothetical protein